MTNIEKLASAKLYAMANAGEYSAAFVAVTQEISERALKLKGKARKKSFEVHHEMEVARKRFLEIVVYAGTAERAAYLARVAVGLAEGPKDYVQ